MGEGVEEHEPADTERDDEHAAQQRADECGAVERGRVEADGAHELAVGDEARDHRLTARRVEREDDRVHRAQQDDLKDVDVLGDREGGADRGDDRGARLGHEEQPPPVRAVGHGAAEEPERKPRDRPRKADEPEIERSQVRDAILDRELHDEPAEAELLHPCPDVRDDEPDPEETEIAVFERRERRGASWFGGGGLIEAFRLEGRSEALLLRRHAGALSVRCGAMTRVAARSLLLLRECMGVEPTTERKRPVNGFEDRGHHRMPRTLRTDLGWAVYRRALSFRPPAPPGPYPERGGSPRPRPVPRRGPGPVWCPRRPS